MSRLASTLTCGLCGHEFDPSDLSCHAECPLASRCTLICCPNCGYQVVDESRTRAASLLRRLVGGGRPRAEKRVPRPSKSAVPLAHVAPGSPVRIASLKGMPPSRSARLSAFGLVPGTGVEIVQRRPVPVIRLGETSLALSDEILEQIWVEAPERASDGSGREAAGR